MFGSHLVDGATIAAMKSKPVGIGIADIGRIVQHRRKCRSRSQNDKRDNRREKLFHDKPPLVVADNFKSEQRDFFFGTNSGFALGNGDLFFDGIDALKVGQQ